MNRTRACVIESRLAIKEVKLQMVETRLTGGSNQFDFAAIATISAEATMTVTCRGQLMTAVNPNTRFVRVDSNLPESVSSKTSMSRTGQLTLTLIGFLETEDYVLEFSNTNSTTVEFEGITYEILPYEFKFPFKNPRSSKQQMETAISQGSTAGALVSIAPDSPTSQDIINLVVSLDPSGITTKAS